MRHRLTWNRERLLRYVLLVAATAAPAAYRTYPSSFDGRPSATRVVLPLDGPVTVAWGGEARSANLHVVAPDQRWGFDLLVTVDRRSYRADGTHLADYFVYGREVRAPAAGIVRTVHDQEPDVAIGGRDRGDDLGNHLSLEVGPGEFMYLAHMQPGSIRPKPGDRVRPGDVLGLVGNSGNSQEPHVHVHLQNSNRRHFAEGVPFAFSDYCAGGTLVRQGIPEGGHTGKAWIGEIIETAPASGCDAVASVGGRRRSARPEAMALYPRLRYLSP
jgi:murein DD-endopeptidase MepM/ murein hydrolase activator NlpD